MEHHRRDPRAHCHHLPCPEGGALKTRSLSSLARHLPNADAMLAMLLQAVMQQMLLSGAEGFDSVNLMRFMSLFAVVMLIPLALFLEGPLAFVNTVSDNMQAVHDPPSLSLPHHFTELLGHKSAMRCSATLHNVIRNTHIRNS